MGSPDISLGICTHKVEKISAGSHPILRRPRKSREGKWIPFFLSAESFFWGIGKQHFMLTGHRNSRTSCGNCVGLQAFGFRPAVNSFDSDDLVNAFCMNTKLVNTWSTVPFRHTHMGKLCILRHYAWLLAYGMMRQRVWYHLSKGLAWWSWYFKWPHSMIIHSDMNLSVSCPDPFIFKRGWSAHVCHSWVAIQSCSGLCLSKYIYYYSTVDHIK